jgi:uncharacterized protein
MVIDVHLPESRSLKDKRMVVRHLLDTARRRYQVAAAEVGHQDHCQRAELAFAAVSGQATQVGKILDAVERFVWSHPELTVLDCRRRWIDPDD